MLAVWWFWKHQNESCMLIQAYNQTLNPKPKSQQRYGASGRSTMDEAALYLAYPHMPNACIAGVWRTLECFGKTGGHQSQQYSCYVVLLPGANRGGVQSVADLTSPSWTRHGQQGEAPAPISMPDWEAAGTAWWEQLTCHSLCSDRPHPHGWFSCASVHASPSLSHLHSPCSSLRCHWYWGLPPRWSRGDHWGTARSWNESVGAHGRQEGDSSQCWPFLAASQRAHRYHCTTSSLGGGCVCLCESVFVCI